MAATTLAVPAAAVHPSSRRRSVVSAAASVMEEESDDGEGEDRFDTIELGLPGPGPEESAAYSPAPATADSATGCGSGAHRGEGDAFGINGGVLREWSYHDAAAHDDDDIILNSATTTTTAPPMAIRRPPLPLAVRRHLAKNLDRTIVEPYGPVVSKLVTNGLCRVRCGLDGLATSLRASSADDSTTTKTKEVVNDNDNIKYDPSEYDDHDDKYEEQLMRRHGRGCIRLSRRVRSLANTAATSGGGGPLRRARRWVRLRTENGRDDHDPAADDDDMATAVTDDMLSSFANDDEFDNEEDDVSCESSTSSDDCGCCFGLLGNGSRRNTNKGRKKGRKRRGWGRRSRTNSEDSASSERDGPKNNKNDNKGRRTTKRKKKRSMGRNKKGGGGNKRRRGGRTKNPNKKSRGHDGPSSSSASPTPPATNFIFRGAPPPPPPPTSCRRQDATPPPAQVFELAQQHFAGYSRHDGPTTPGQRQADGGFDNNRRSRTYSSPAAFGHVIFERPPSDLPRRKEEVMRAATAAPAPPSTELLNGPREEGGPHHAKQRQPSVHELIRDIDEALNESESSSEEEEEEMEEVIGAGTTAYDEGPTVVPSVAASSGDEDRVVLVPPSDCPQVVDPSVVLDSSADLLDPRHSVKVVFLSSPKFNSDKSALVDALTGGGVPRSSSSAAARSSSTGSIAIRSLPIHQHLTMSLWDVPSGTGQAPTLAHSANAVYVVVYDLGTSNPATYVRKCSDAYDAERAARAADRALERDVDMNVASFVANVVDASSSCCARGSVVLPVVFNSCADAALPRDEEERRLAILNKYLADRTGGSIGLARSLVVDSIDDLDPLKKEIILNATRHALPTEPSLHETHEQIRRMILGARASGAKIIAVDDILDRVSSATKCQVQASLEMLASSGDLLYYGRKQEEEGIIGEYAVLDIKFLFSVVASVLRPDYSEDVSALRASTSKLGEKLAHCHIISTVDVSLLWQSMAFVKDAFPSHSSRPTSRQFFDFLRQVLVERGIFSPLEIGGATYYLIPTHLRPMPEEAFTYKTPEVWRTLLCHSWLFDSKMAKSSYEAAVLSLLQDIFSSEYVVDQVMLFQSALFVRIGLPSSTSSIDVLCHIVEDNASNLSVATASTSSSSSRVVVSARGLAGDDGQRIWDGGYRAIISSLDAVFAKHSGMVQRETVCPECLATDHPSNAATWQLESLVNASDSQELVRCLSGHEVETALLCGRRTMPANRRASRRESKMHDENRSLHRSSSSVSNLLGGVVIVGLYDETQNKIQQIGSGFVADKSRGLIITASHVLYDMYATGNEFGRPYYGNSNAKAVIGVLSDADSAAVFRYCAEVLVEDVCRVDACVLRITTRFDQDVTSIEGCAMQPERPVSFLASPFRELQELKLTKHCELEESIRILGYNQGGEGVLPIGGHVNRYPDFAKGYVCKKFKVDGRRENASSEKCHFTPLEEIVAICPTIDGHSGGPVVNASGSVIGILSRADSADNHRCYLVPSIELKQLLKKAKKQSRLSPTELYNRMSANSGH